MAPDPRFLWNPEEEINGYKYENSYYTLSSSNGVVFDDIIKIEYPLNTKGYIEYKK
ncbi:hypothetical protein LEP1GSC115_2180 [Leptospira interrogans serovar Australis str. 200703203]|nr:hypothetical protein LEP1GSC115_2180 [Leptospira interrogans serovar Australis str. 200703203]